MAAVSLGTMPLGLTEPLFVPAYWNPPTLWDLARQVGFDLEINLLIAGGFILLAAAWRVLYAAQQAHALATTGPYAHVRHPQYAGFILIMLGFLFQWPTVLTLAMFPILVAMYVRLARREEREVRAEFGEAYARYAAMTPAFIPRLRPAAARRV